MSITIEDILKKKKVAELRDIAFRLDVEHPEGRRTRDEWIQLDAEALRSRMKLVRQCIDPFGLITLRTMAKFNRSPEGDFRIHIDQVDGLELMETMDDLEDLGLAWFSRNFYMFPSEMDELIQFDKKEENALTACHKLFLQIDGALRFYGMMEVKQLAAMLLPNLETGWTILLQIYSRRRGLNGLLNAGDHTYWLLCPELEEPQKLYSLLTQSALKELPYATFSSTALISAAHELLPLPDTLYGRLRSWYQTIPLDESEQDDALMDAVFGALNGDQKKYYLYLCSPFHEDVPPLFLDAARRTLRALPQWIYKGHSLKELDDMQHAPDRQPARSDLCPCGSGKRYRDCCGNQM